MELAFLLKAGLLKEEEENVYVADSRLKNSCRLGRKGAVMRMRTPEDSGLTSAVAF